MSNPQSSPSFRIEHVGSSVEVTSRHDADTLGASAGHFEPLNLIRQLRTDLAAARAEVAALRHERLDLVHALDRWHPGCYEGLGDLYDIAADDAYLLCHAHDDPARIEQRQYGEEIYRRGEAARAEVDGLRERVSDLNVACPQCLKLEGQIAGIEEDALRYRWLKEKHAYAMSPHMDGTMSFGLNGCHWRGQSLDAAIDAAIAKEPK